MNNEPVAWAREDGVIAFFEKPKVDKQGFKWFPLYTHPAKDNYRETHEGFSTVIDATHPAKTLTDEEIEQIASQYLTAHAQFIGAGEVTYDGEVEFARAILRKAQEK